MSHSTAPRASKANKVFTLSTLANYLNVSREDVLKMARAGRIPGQKINGKWRFRKKAIDQWLDHQFQQDLRALHPNWMSSPSVSVQGSGISTLGISTLDSGIDRVPDRLNQPGSKQAVLKYFGIFEQDNDLEEHLANLHAYRQVTEI